MARRRIFIALVGLLTIGGASMALGKTLIMASEMQGQLVDASGAPAAGVTVTRTWQTHKEKASESTTTDAEGRFAFGEATKRSFMAGLLPSTPVIDEQFTHDHAGSPSMFLRLSKRSYSANSELNGRPIRVVCRVDASAQPGPGAILESTCEIID